MKELTQSKILKRNYGIDILKVLASFAVVMIHVESNFRPYEFIANTELWNSSILVNLISKWGVPAFIMASGYFILNQKEEKYSEFLRKRFSKVLIPFLAASFIFNIYFQYLAGKIDIKWAMIGVLKNLFGYPIAIHLWFLYPLIGLYLLTPIFRGILDKINKKHVLVLIIICFFVKTVVPFVDTTVGWQYSYWRDIPIATNAFALYFILGGYIGRTDFKRNHKILIHSITGIIVIIAFLLTFNMDILYSRNLEVFFDIISINNIMICMSLFIVFKNLNFSKCNSRIFTTGIEILSEVSFGVFLFHPLIIDIIKPRFMGYNENIFIMIIIQSVLVYIVTIFITYIIKRIPIIRKIA